MKIVLTNRQILEADQALAALSHEAFPMALALKVAHLRFAVLSVARVLQDTRRADTERRATDPETGKPKLRDADNGQLTYVLSPEENYAAQKEWDETLKLTHELEVTPLTLADFPAKIKGDDVAIAADVLVSLGPLVTLEP